jgi:pyridoxamine 5'-phosphate oxidase
MRAFAEDPLLEFEKAFGKAMKEGVKEANAMALASVDPQGRPSVRIVYYKGLVRGGLSFFTNYQGKKSLDFEKNSWAAVNFFWPELFEQVRVQGKVDKLEREESEAYFRTRPRMSQIGAWASHQSEEIPDHSSLMQRFRDLEKKFDKQDIPCPPHWGGFRLVPSEIEFWVGREGRLHERYVYERNLPEDVWRSFMRSP